MKDPAFLFYTSDFLTGTMLMTLEQRGVYITLLCIQHQKGRLSKRIIEQVSSSVEDMDYVLEKFAVDENGLYYNERLEEEVEKRKKYSESRRNNRKKADYENACVYLMIDDMTNHMKIGFSNNPLRRLLELRAQHENDNIHLFASVDNVSQKIEAELHKKFAAKCVYNEWFSLSKEEINSIIQEYNMTLHINNHMIVHMENENENENINKDIIKEKGVKGGKTFVPDYSTFKPEFQEAIKLWFDYKKEKGKSIKGQIELSRVEKKLENLSKEFSITAMAIVEHSISNGYAGLFAPSKTITNNHEQPKQPARRGYERRGGSDYD